MAKILIVEDEPDVAELVSFNLQRAGHETLVAHDGIAAVDVAFHELPDLIVLDLMLPGRDGFGVFKELRRDSRTTDTPVIMLTARAQTEDRIQGLEAGADDYLTKPFSPKELLLRVQSILRRAATPPGSAELSLGPFRFDMNKLKFYIDGDPVGLTSTEFKLLLHLAERAGQAQNRHDVLRSVLGYRDEVHSRTLDTHMKRLRSKLGSYSDMLETVRGVGYRVRKPSP